MYLKVTRRLAQYPFAHTPRRQPILQLSSHWAPGAPVPQRQTGVNPDAEQSLIRHAAAADFVARESACRGREVA